MWNFESYKCALAKRGFMMLGSGMYACVYAKPGSNRVIKVVCGDQYWQYAEFCVANPSPHRPVIHSIKWHFPKFEGREFDNRPFYVVVMDRIAETVFNSFALNNPAARERGLRFHEGVLSHPNRDMFPGEAQCLDEVREAFPFAAFDFHSGNWMIHEDGTIVLTDPFVGSGDKRRTRTRRLKTAPTMRLAA